MLAILLLDRPWRVAPFVALGAAMVFLVNVKFTGLIFVVLFIAVVVLAGVRRSGVRAAAPSAAVLVVILGVAVVIIGFNPYVTNTVRHRSPLHPVLGPNAVDIAEVHTGRALRDKSNLGRLAASFTSRTNASGEKATTKLPFTASGDEWRAFEFPNVRIGGFGPLFSGISLLALATAIGLLVLRLRRGRAPTPGAQVLLAFALVLAISAVVLPDSFLARFAPQIWFVPLLVLVVGLQPEAGRVVRVIAWSGVLVALLNAVVIAAVAVQLDVRASRREEESLTRLAANPAGFDAEFGRWVRAESRRLREAGVRFRAVPRGSLAECPNPQGLTFEGRLVRVDPDRNGRLFRGVILCPRA